jgi:hypothetical protein
MASAGPLVAPFVVDQGELVPGAGVTWTPHNPASVQALVAGAGLRYTIVAGVLNEWAPGAYTAPVADALISEHLPDYSPAKYDLETWWQFDPAFAPANQFARFHVGLQNIALRNNPLIPPNMGNIEISTGKLRSAASLSALTPTGVFARYIRNGVDSFSTLPSVVGFTPTDDATFCVLRVSQSQIAEYAFGAQAAPGWPDVATCVPPVGLTLPSIAAFTAPLAGATPTRCAFETDPVHVGVFCCATNGGAAVDYVFTLQRMRVRYRVRYP